MGGAGFPTGSKWEIVRNAAGKEKYIVCNADESEPAPLKIASSWRTFRIS
jgi:NADH:ubiquinone oxidoreductase subunit F (NADH-binding)